MSTDTDDRKSEIEHLRKEIKALEKAIGNHRHVKFCYLLVKHDSATKAAIEAGFSEKTAPQQGSRLFNKVKCKELVRLIRELAFAELQIDSQWLLRQLYLHATVDDSRILDEFGAVLPVSQWPADVKTVLNGIDIKEEIDFDTGTVTGYVKKIKRTDKLKALEMMGRHKAIKAFDTSVQLEAGDSLLEAITRGKQRSE